MRENQVQLYEQYGVYKDVLKPGVLPVPEIGEGDVLIKVVASAINPVDWKLMEGLLQFWPQEFPMVPGWDVAGIIEQSNSSDFTVGDEVYAYTRAAFDMLDAHPECKSEKIGKLDGTHSSYVAVKAWKVAKKPKTATFAEAAAVPLAALTAYQGLHDKGGISEGKTVLITAGSGGVGSYAIGFAKHAGARVITTCSARNFEYVKSLGADEVRDYNVEGYLKGIEADLVLDCAGGNTAEDALAAVKENGKMVSIVEFDIAERAKKVNRTAEAFLVAPAGDTLTTIAQLIDDKKVKIPNITTMPFNKIQDAFAQIKSHRTVGKIVLLRE